MVSVWRGSVTTDLHLWTRFSSMRALFVFLCLPVLFQRYLLSEILATVVERCHRRGYYDSLVQPQWSWLVSDSTKPQPIPPTKPLLGRPTWYQRSHVALWTNDYWVVIIEPYRVCLSECSFILVLVRLLLLNWNKLSHCHPLESIASFVHPIPFFSTLLLFVSIIIFWVVLMIIILDVVWYACWHFIKQINPLLLPAKEVLHMGSTNSNSMFNIAVYLE